MKSTKHLWLEESLSKAIWKWKSTKTLTYVVFVSLLILTIFRILTSPPFDDLWFKIFQEKQPIQEKIHDKFLGGILLPGLDENSCESRYRSNLYRKPRPFGPPSSYLVSKLRKYEALQKKCGPNTESYNKAVEDIKFGREVNEFSSCKYVLYIPIKGLGNRMITIGSTFLYALLTNRVLFIGDGGDTVDLFCEPFPEVSWKLPSDFPLSKIRTIRPFEPNNKYGNLLQNGTFGNSSVPLSVYFHLGYGYDNNEKNFFCDHDQELLQEVPWLILRSDLYFMPSLFLIPSFRKELNDLFPEKEMVFHHLGRYLFHPSNSVWGLITRYYEAYLANADEILGIQIRFYRGGGRKTPLTKQVMDCAVNNNLLPNINKTEPLTKQSKNPTKKAVLITSLSSDHSEYLKKMYWQYATITEEAISVHQTCHDERQRSQNLMHDMKALADIYLLSLSDKLMISGYSTFGYAAQSLGGLHPWILNMPHSDQIVPNPPCQQSLSMEPCYHYPPSFYECRNSSRFKAAFHVPYVKHCEDFPSGLKLFN